jgi:prepilin peptidase CpaA
MTIPKWLSVPTLALGLLFNVVRGGWMGWLDRDNWLLERGGWGIGALDGLLFALAGFAVAFALFFVLWILGTCGGGDVKLCAALGAWVGPLWTLFLLVGTMLCLITFGIARLVWSLFTQGMQATKKDYYARHGKKPHAKQPREAVGRQGFLVPRKRLVTFSLPVAVATAVVLMWVCRRDLGLTHSTNANTPPAPRPRAQARGPVAAGRASAPSSCCCCRCCSASCWRWCSSA